MKTLNPVKKETDDIMFGRVTTSGIVSGYQITNVTTSSVSIESTDQFIFIPTIKLPSFDIPFFDDIREVISSKSKKNEKVALMKRGYKALSRRNKELAEELFPIDIEKWPEWES